MSYAIGKPVVSANIVIDETETAVAVGDSVSGMVVVGPRGEYEVSGTVVGISLGRKSTNHPLGPIFDGVPTFTFESDDLANIHNAVDYFEVDYLMIEVPAETEGDPSTFERVPVNKIKAMSGGITEDTTGDESGSTDDGSDNTGTEDTGATA